MVADDGTFTAIWRSLKGWSCNLKIALSGSGTALELSVHGISLHHSVTYHSVTYHSVTSSLRHFITPSLHHFITPSLHHSVTSSLRHFITLNSNHSFIQHFLNHLHHPFIFIAFGQESGFLFYLLMGIGHGKTESCLVK